ncbi:cell division topological specificity factor [Acetoanaerobium pronyense]|uniref:Cell division topological specificity factor n=1 Tax=Acetoanaerobium pronyense TaxID=1482736 RepID=A0ABS4KLK5_9FIRM|nr:cell division topological specificity factor MinE [Acetoanaerobium pronyense]MBP2028101.1 cell division topological specificity factor [Acetoanaerobium pronyense]
MLDIFKFFSNDKKASKNVAKERLKLVLIHDKGNYSPSVLESLRVDILKVIDNYMEVDEENIDVKMIKTKSQDGGEFVPALVANIPIKRMK